MDRPLRPPRRSAGFTLIEIMVVITLIGLIATLVVPGVMTRLEEGRVTTTEARMSTLKSVLDTYRMKHSAYPESLSELLEPSDKNMGEPFIEDPGQLNDAWDQPFQYIRSSRTKCEIISLGADGLDGGDNADADISSDKNKMVGQ